MNFLNPFASTPNLSSIVRRYFWTSPIVATLAMTIGLLEGAGVSLLIPFLSTLADNTSMARGGALSFVAHFAEGHSRNERLLLVTLGILFCVLLKSALQVVANSFVAWVDGRIGHDIRCSLSERLQSSGYAFFLLQDSTRLVNIFNVESWKASETVRVVLTRISAATTTVVFGSLLLVVSYQLSLIVLAGGLAARYVQKRMEARLRASSEYTVSSTQAMVDQMLFTVFGARLIRLFDYQRAEHLRFASASEEVRRAVLRIESLSGTLLPILEAMHGLLFLIVLIVAVFTGVRLPVLAAFLVLMNRLQPPLRILEQSGTAFASAGAQLAEVDWLLDPRDKPTPPPGHISFSALKDRVEFHNVTFEYGNSGQPALSEASFFFRRGRSTALIGGSGAGKSTVLNLLCRLLEPVSGVITVDGETLSKIKVSDWLNTIAIAGQDVELANGTIAANIAYGRPNMNRSTIEQAARDAGADFIDSLPQGFESLVGQRGLSLSGGQRQRIGIARALARMPEILILDEATSSVDHLVEGSIVQTLTNLPKSMTVIVVSHRPSTISFCDDAIVLEQGRVVEFGPLLSIKAYWAMMDGVRPDR